MTRPLARLAVPLLAAVLLLGGCGADLHPGAAAKVGSDTLSQSDADRTVREVCSGVLSQTKGTATRYALSTLQLAVVQSWVQRSMASQLAKKYDVGPGTAYEQTLAQAKTQLTGLSTAQRDRVLDIYTANAYFVGVVSAVGRSVLVANGTAAPTSADSITQGISTAQIWEQTHPIVTAPRYPDLELGDNAFTVTPDATSVAVSDFAREAAAKEPSQAYVATLPDSQVCGRSAG